MINLRTTRPVTLSNIYNTGIHKMAVVDHHPVSDEEFDLIDSVEPVSGLSSPTDQPTNAQPLPGRHYGRPFDGSRSASRRRATEEERDNEDHGGNIGSSALKYTKSVVDRIWSGQDLLIAVMGYVATASHPALLISSKKRMLTSLSSPL